MLYDLKVALVFYLGLPNNFSQLTSLLFLLLYFVLLFSYYKLNTMKFFVYLIFLFFRIFVFVFDFCRSLLQYIDEELKLR